MSDTTAPSKILVISEEKNTCNMVAKIVQSMGCSCECVGLKTVGSLDMIDSINIDIAILNVEPNDTHGLGLVKKMASLNPRLDVIMMSKHMHSYTYGEIIEAGAADFIAKPFDMSELKVKVKRIIRERNLLAKSKELKTALEVLLAEREQQHRDLTGKTLMNMEALILPCLRRLESTRLNEIQRIYVEMLKSGVMEISSPFRAKHSQKHLNLSPMEVQVAKLITSGRENKEIAEILGVSVNTIMTHRYHLRTKLGVKGKKINLRSYINSIEIQ